MCDTLYKDGIFGKNSDRDADEPNLVVFCPSRDSVKSEIKCTYIEISDVPHTFATLLVKPKWTWGAEMGINEFGVAIGNEAVFTKCKSKKESLIGMDYVRLALERAKSARDAVTCIIELLGEHGQGGNCGYGHKFYYDNSYLIADRYDCFILETAGKEYAMKRVVGSGNISNKLQLTKDYTLASVDSTVNFAATYSDKLYTTFSKAAVREETGALMLSKMEPATIGGMMNILKSHVDAPKLYTKGSVASICMHNSTLGDHTTGSMIVNLTLQNPTIWVTGCSTPCLALYKPVYFGYPIPPLFALEKESLAYWLDREYLHRAIFSGLVDEKAYKAKIVDLQNRLIELEVRLRDENRPMKEFLDLSKYACDCEAKIISSYSNIIETVKDGEVKLVGNWNKRQLK